MKKYLLPLLMFFSIWNFSGCTENSFMVFFDSNGGSAVKRIKVKEGHRVNKPDDPVKSGYKLVNWYRDKDLMLVFNFETDIINSDITLYAKWRIKRPTFTVTFNLNGGSGITPSPQTIEAGYIVIDPQVTPTNNGKIFAGWSGNKDSQGGADLFQLNTRTISGDTTLYAVWINDNIQNKLLAAINKIKNQPFVYAKGEQVLLLEGAVSDNVWIDYKNKKFLSKTYTVNNPILGRCIYLDNEIKYFYDLATLNKTTQSEAFEMLVYNEFYTPYIDRMIRYLNQGGENWQSSNGQYEISQTEANKITRYWAKLNGSGFVEEVGYRTTENGSGTDSAKIVFKYDPESLSYPETELGDRGSFTKLPTKKVTIHWSDKYNDAVVFQSESAGKYYINVSSSYIGRFREIFSGEKCNGENCWKSYQDKNYSREFKNTENTYEITGMELEVYAKKL